MDVLEQNKKFGEFMRAQYASMTPEEKKALYARRNAARSKTCALKREQKIAHEKEVQAVRSAAMSREMELSDRVAELQKEVDGLRFTLKTLVNVK